MIVRLSFDMPDAGPVVTDHPDFNAASLSLMSASHFGKPQNLRLFIDGVEDPALAHALLVNVAAGRIARAC